MKIVVSQLSKEELAVENPSGGKVLFVVKTDAATRPAAGRGRGLNRKFTLG